MNAIPPLQIKAGRDGFVLVPDPMAPFPDILQQLRQKLEESRDFFKRSQMTLDLSKRPFRENEVQALQQLLAEVARVSLAEIRLGTNLQPLLRWASQTLKTQLVADARPESTVSPARPAPEQLGQEVKVVRTTCRSGTRIESAADCVVLGDVNPGAEIFAAGDIVVFGNLRGIAHAGILGDRSARIMALSIEPSQLRIADLVALPPKSGKPVPKRYEIAEIRSGQIQVTTV